MADTFSFDVVSDFDRQELVNALDQAQREVHTRYDLKDTGTDATLEDSRLLLKSSSEFNSIPVILVTSKDSASDKYWGEQQGADGYVTKPFTREELLRAVRRFA